MIKNMVHADACRLCQSKNVKLMIPLKPIPLAEKYMLSEEAAKRLEKFPVDIFMCLGCGHVQLLDIMDSSRLWDDYTYYSGQNKEMIDHLTAVAEKIIQMHHPILHGLIIDVGSNDGTLLKRFKEKNYRVLGIDPATEIAKKASDSGIPTLPELINKKVAIKILNEYGSAAVVTAFNVFAHADNLDEMLSSIRYMLSADGIFVFECQYLMDIVDNFLIGTIFHEHMSHHSLIPLNRFLKKHGMELIDVERVSIQGGSIIGTAQLIGGQRPIKNSVNELLSIEKSRYFDKPEILHVFSNKLKEMEIEISRLVSYCKENGLSIAGFGAARSGPTLLSQFSLGKHIEYVFDDHPMKVGKFTSGDGIKVLPAADINHVKPDYVFILAWNYPEKIIKNNFKYLEDGGKFVIFSPNLKIIDASMITLYK